jgi:hypothetical protein
MKWLIRIGGFLVILGIGAFFFKDSGHTLPFSNNFDNFLIFLGVGLIGLFIVIVLLSLIMGKTWQQSKKNRCARCGKKVAKGEVYCEFHRSEVSNEFLTHQGDRREMRKGKE